MDGWRAEVSRAVGRLPSGFGSAFQVSHHLALTRLAQTRLGQLGGRHPTPKVVLVSHRFAVDLRSTYNKRPLVGFPLSPFSSKASCSRGLSIYTRVGQDRIGFETKRNDTATSIPRQFINSTISNLSSPPILASTSHAPLFNVARTFTFA